ncbi:alpha/beta family hydrolase [Variovorax sp. KK3]|uniref:alpha/beta hydrolase family protein n=1 Tax=Variovorax sp. KK3 TaxID=1855728 RepID=UPI00097CBD6E|nr:alpha/beta family hydrolase [Variovorax sp. KK3]
MSSSTTEIQEIRFAVGEQAAVSGLVQAPPEPRACYVFGHGAGAGMRHAFMAAVADGLAARGIATLRYQFPSMELGKKRPDPPPVAHATVRAAAAQAAQRFGALPLYAGGKSFGGRMTSQAQALQPLPGVKGLVFVGFPLHPAGPPATKRADHLAEVRVPMLFVQGTRDELAEIGHLRTVVSKLGTTATLVEIAEADHAFHVLRRSGRTDAEVLQELLDGIAAWIPA